MAVYQVQAPHAAQGTTEVMTVAVVTLDGQGVTPVVSVLDNKGNPVAAQVLAAEGGAYVVQVTCSAAAPNYLIQVKGGAAGLSTWTGAYYLDATFGTTAASPEAIASGAAHSSGPPRPRCRSAPASCTASSRRPRAPGDPRLKSERVTITDALGDVVASLTVYSGQSESLTLLLGPGTYRVTVAAIVPFLDFNPPPSLLLVGMDFSDPIKAFPTNSGSSSPPRGPGDLKLRLRRRA